MNKKVKCRVCGCDDDHACISPNGVPCHWVEKDLCSECGRLLRKFPKVSEKDMKGLIRELSGR